eukprot:Hpha_TRINITY_DN33787_c0_g1::TRINITY_DN33787_c0_g1_i1::g.24955::m.24955
MVRAYLNLEQSSELPALRLEQKGVISVVCRGPDKGPDGGEGGGAVGGDGEGEEHLILDSITLQLQSRRRHGDRLPLCVLPRVQELPVTVRENVSPRGPDVVGGVKVSEGGVVHPPDGGMGLPRVRVPDVGSIVQPPVYTGGGREPVEETALGAVVLDEGVQVLRPGRLDAVVPKLLLPRRLPPLCVRLIVVLVLEHPDVHGQVRGESPLPVEGGHGGDLGPALLDGSVELANVRFAAAGPFVVPVHVRAGGVPQPRLRDVVKSRRQRIKLGLQLSLSVVLTLSDSPDVQKIRPGFSQVLVTRKVRVRPTLVQVVGR